MPYVKQHMLALWTKLGAAKEENVPVFSTLFLAFFRGEKCVVEE